MSKQESVANQNKSKAVKSKKAAKKKGAPKTKKSVSTKKSADKARLSTKETKQNRGVNDLFNTNHVKITEDIMTQSKTQFDQFTQEATATGQAYTEALTQSGHIFAKGFEDIFKTYVSIAQTTAEKNSQAFQSLLGCKSLDEYTEAQNKVAQQSFDDLTVCVTKLSEMSIKVTTEAFEPINDQVSKSIKKASDSAAA